MTAAAAADRLPPAAADLAQTEDAQITPDIQALAASLDHQPLRIYDWVRNTIDFVPTYGSVQGSQMTLDAKRGNAFDTASLLIALLRAAGVPSRYVTGTVRIPVAEAMNWTGSPTPEVAQQQLGQGGIPNVALVSGGRITHIQLQHVWVEAYIDFIPSRSAIHREGDTWVAMDPSFKRHELIRPQANFLTDIPLEPPPAGEALFTVDETLGRVTAVDTQALDEQVGAWAAAVDDYLLANGIEGAFEGVLGGRSIVQETSRVFPTSLPYPIPEPGAAQATLPDSLRHYVTLKGYGSRLDRAIGSASLSVRLSLPRLNSRRLGIQFIPASQTDAATLEALRNSGAAALPVYLIDLIPTVQLDGDTLDTGNPIGMGNGYFLDVVLQSPGDSTTIPYEVVAGDEIVVGVTGNGLTREIIEKRFAAHPVDNAPEYLHQVQLHYWMETDYLNEIAAQALDVHMLRLPSVGLFSSPLNVAYFFGIPRTGTYQGRFMDVKQSLLGVAGPDPSRVLAFTKQAGFHGSYMEGAVFDQLENRAEPTIRGISAVHLIATAANQGIPIYRIRAGNAAAALPRLSLGSAVESDIRNAVNRGKTVLVPESNIDLGLWSGVGYIIQDETTGAGAYLISGGINGGGLLDCLEELVPVFAEVLELVLILLLAILLLVLLIAAIAWLAPVLAGAGAALANAFSYFLLLLRGLAPLALA